MDQRLISTSLEQTQHVGEQLASSLKGGDIVLLFGDLGAGKTTFMQGVAKGLGIEQRIISPTFIIMRKYNGKDKTLYHLDLYRTNSEKDLEGLGLKEILEDKNAVVAIEWPEKLESLTPEKRIEVRLNNISEDERKINIQYVG